MEDSHVEARHALDLFDAHAPLRRGAGVSDLRPGAAGRRLDGADVQWLPVRAREYVGGRDSPAPALEGRADRVRPGVVRAADRRLDLADAVGDLQIERGVDRDDAG